MITDIPRALTGVQRESSMTHAEVERKSLFIIKGSYRTYKSTRYELMLSLLLLHYFIILLLIYTNI